MVSNKNTDGRRKRPYTLKARARRRDEVHRRITLAAVHLHGTVGPARTTVSDIAKHARVRRATVYNHFASDRELLDACSSHWFAENPPPDPSPWSQISAPRTRAETALVAMYDYYEHGRAMLDNVLRDAPLVPALAEVLETKWTPLLEAIVAMLAEGWRTSGVAARDRDRDLRASLQVALDFFTWKTLAAAGLSSAQAAGLATSWIAAGHEGARAEASGARPRKIS